MEAVMLDSMDQARAALLERRDRLEAVITDAPEAPGLARLLEEVDATLARLDAGTFGTCEVCHGAVERERISADPLVRTCLDCMSVAEQRALESDLDLAAEVQRGLLPPQRFRVEGWEAAYHYEPVGSASGDYVDLVPLDSGDLLFLIGDVSGKGVAASLLMTHLHAIVRSLVAVHVPFGELTSRVNRIFHETVGGNQYVTLVCGKAGRAGDVELSIAGHCPPIAIGSARTTTLPSTSVPIGMFARAPFGTRHVKLERGDSLVLYTDGVTDTVDTEGGEYGLQRLSSLAAAHRDRAIVDLVTACVDDLVRFRGTARRRDDVTLFVLKRR